ncbi:phosphomannomutase [Campylobacter hyointestinalis]|uniref:Phosphomannomutase n=1 Tax=Campylobacter hyointestinalis subsp. hyointestinalis TaxID=91352 RepID=A0A0S4SA96_CAMHY|nr:phosphomannomutase/phosphoglucomutase [Campylobacter hyointestinalis]PPB53915.1 phosphomannomutase/phosphoglucomutase [Campylobacter hyointestinalis subsp. hyointestinalis]PPB54937.1 phosphomannomutase/phosphoglucomutase [Campylobacter hyointestinalis subsp. hyointestinalis]PPB61738.1 phosphomannomutase/phosphoglucomutase [Campylobacter hyointestinalis subsp. hyointestinalis]PPB64908.1 phosphomannomutase/phosphoglucomutase [Campylobacter hyointestinalis subsp. hyointestinalis]PPB65945.1 pho
MFETIFREYDIRGIYEKDLNELSVKAIGYCLGITMKNRGVKSVSVGFDARLSARALFGFLVSGLNRAELEVFDIGMLPTPVGYFSVFTGVFDANIMITGSHNPKEYNGFKITIGVESFFGADLQKLKDRVNEFLSSGEVVKDDFRATKFDVLSRYVQFYEKEFSHLKGLKTKIICDCANGVAGIALERVVKALCLNATLLYKEPDGNFPNHHPDPSEERNLKDLKTALKGEFEIGFGFDGDADRIAVLTKKRVIKGDDLAYLYAKNMKNPRVLGEVKCSQNMYDEIDKIGKSFMGKTGHSNIKKAMRELNIDMAAEVSGHIFFKERFFGFDDAIYAMIRVLELVQKGFELDAELDKLPVLYSTDEIKVSTKDETKFKIIDELKKELNKKDNGLPNILDIIDIDGVRIKFDGGWALVRASNTTPVLVTRFEASSQEFVKLLEEKVLNLVEGIKSELN